MTKLSVAVMFSVALLVALVVVSVNRPLKIDQPLESAQDFVWLDVRTFSEVQQDYLPEAEHIPLSMLDKQADNILPDKSQVIYVFCRSGQRASKARELLMKKGYQSVINIGSLAAAKKQVGLR